MGPLADLNELYVYNGWANGRILDAVAELSDRELWKDLGSSFPSVGATVVHLLAAEWVWVSRWEGTSPRSMSDGWSGGTVADLRDRWTDLQERQRAFLGTLGERDLDRVVDYTNLAGEPHRSCVITPLYPIVLGWVDPGPGIVTNYSTS